MPRNNHPETVSEVLRRAACELGTFPIEQLTVKAWSLSQEQFGLAHYRDRYPDHNKVVACLADKRSGPIARGWIERVSTGLYRVTEAGRQA